MLSLEVTFFDKSRINVILPALDNNENMKDNIKYSDFLLVIRGCAGYYNSFETSGWLLHMADHIPAINQKLRLHCPNSYYRNTTSEL